MDMSKKRKKIEWRESRAVAIFMKPTGQAFYIVRVHGGPRFDSTRHFRKTELSLSNEGAQMFAIEDSHKVNNNYWEAYNAYEPLIVRENLKEKLDFILGGKNE
jgi:hypothetical protein